MKCKAFFERSNGRDTALNKNYLYLTLLEIAPLCVYLSHLSFQTYMVQLDSTLSKSVYKYAVTEVSFVANTSYKHFTFEFEPKVGGVQGSSGSPNVLEGSRIVIHYLSTELNGSVIECS